MPQLLPVLTSDAANGTSPVQTGTLATAQRKPLPGLLTSLAAALVALSQISCSSHPAREEIADIFVNAGQTFAQISRAHRDATFEAIVSRPSQNNPVIPTDHEAQMEAHLQLKLAQIISGFYASRSAMREFDQDLQSLTKKDSRNAEIETDLAHQNHDSDLISQIEGTDTYRSLATEQLVNDILFLKKAVELNAATVSSAHTNAVGAAMHALAWFKNRGKTLTPTEHLALQPFAEALLNLAPSRESVADLTEFYLVDSIRLLEIERDSSVQKQLEAQGKFALLHADQEMLNWVAHYSKAHWEAQNEFEYYPNVVGRKHRASMRSIASAVPQGPAAELTAGQREPPIRPLTARSLAENDFVLIYSGKLHSAMSLRLLSELNRETRPATFFVESDNSVKASRPGATIANSDQRFPLGFKPSRQFTFASRGDALFPLCLQNNSELESSMQASRIHLESLKLPTAPFYRPGFDAESSRIGRIAREQHLRLVRTSISTFDQIDFDPKRVAARVTQQILKQKSGLVEFHAGSPRALEIQEELNRFVEQKFKNPKTAPRFIALSTQTGEV